MVTLYVFITVVFVVVYASPTIRRMPLPNRRIIGGNDSDISKHPWQISIQLFGNHICSGSLINKEWILSAAHCVENSMYQNLITIKIGSTHSDYGGETIRPSGVIIHPGWNFEETHQYDNDIALIKLSSPVTIDIAKAVTLPSPSFNLSDGADIVVSGWGATQENGTSVSTLQEVTVPYVSVALCNELYSHTAYHISTNMLCAGYVGVGGKDACQGDSGGPAVFHNEVLVGIISWGLGCARASYPGVYVRVTEYLHWINSTLHG